LSSAHAATPTAIATMEVGTFGAHLSVSKLVARATENDTETSRG
jgi:hypothetical protein